MANARRKDSQAKNTTPDGDSGDTDTGRFLRVLFGDDYLRAWVAAFREDPFAPSQLPDRARAAKLSARMWGGGIYRKMRHKCTDDANQYVAISVFKATPWRDASGVEHITPKRRKSHFERACAIMVDDIGVDQKVHPDRVRLPFSALVETSPGNCQGWYALEARDADSYDPDLIALLIERMVSAGLTKDNTDPGMKGATRYGRLPAGVNNKPGREPWRVRLKGLHEDRVYTVKQIASAYGLDLTRPAAAPAEMPDDAAESLVPRLRAAGVEMAEQGDGKWFLASGCLWQHEHTGGVDDGRAAYFLPSAANGWAGGYRCQHGHCDSRGIGDVYRWLEEREGASITELGRLLKPQATSTEKRLSSRVTAPLPELPLVDRPKRRAEFSDDELMSAEHPDIPWLVEGLIMPGLTLLAAPPKMGKSYLVLQMGLCVAAGVPFLGRKTRKARVSYFDLEEWEELLQRRRKHIGAANGIVSPSISYALEVSGGDVTVLHDIDRHVREKGSELIIIDLLARVRDELGEDSRKNAYARDYAALRKFADFILQRHPHIAVVLVHHTNKGQHEDWQSKISGSQGLAGASHTNMLMTHVDLRGLDDEARTEALKYRKLHVAGKAVEPTELMLEMMPAGGGWQVTDRTSEEIKTFGKHALILQVLREARGRWVTAKEVKEVVEGTLDSIKRMLARMAKKGEIESGGQGGPGYRLRPDA